LKLFDSTPFKFCILIKYFSRIYHMLKPIALIFFVLFFAPILYGQTEKPMNYKKFDRRLLHFGFLLGGNSAGFTMDPKLNNFANYELKSISEKPQPGGQIGIITSLRLGSPVFRLRFIPTLSFQERAISYQYSPKKPTLQDPNPSKKDVFDEQRISSTNLDFPLMLQFRTLRYNNFAAYVLGGAQYTIDLQSQEKKNQSFNDPFVKIKRDDLQGQVGGGVEFFMPYFKLGLEIKFSHSWTNALIQDNTKVSLPIQSLQNRIWWFSITFEG
jgi:hypothetical protein